MTTLWSDDTFLQLLYRLDVAVFAFTPDSAFPVYADARWAVAWSVFVAVVGILCDLCLVCWFIVDAGTFKVIDLVLYWYHFSDTFQTRALDFEGSYLTFSLKSRVPALCAIISSSFLGVFVALTVFRGQIVGVAIIMVAVFIFTTMSYWIHGIRRSLSGIVRGSRAAWQRIACFF